MPKSSPQELKTKAAYNAKPENVAKRVENNRARREAIKEGRAQVGDGTHVDHVKPLDKGGATVKGNLRVTSAEFNKGWRARQPEMYGKKK
jgi:hypothetical protein